MTPCKESVTNALMTGKDKNTIGRRLVNAYLSSVVSIALVLLFVGIASLLLLNAKSVSNYFKEHIKVSVILNDDVSETDALTLVDELTLKPYVKEAVYVSREQGASEMKALLGDDFLDVFEASPIPISIDLGLKAEYVSADSLAFVKDQLTKQPMISELVYQKSLIDKLNTNLGKISVVMSVFIALLLFISFVLINNTVRLSLHSRRFTIRTMQMVGATRSFIRAPFLAQAAFQGLLAALVSNLLLTGLMFLVKAEFRQMFEIFSIDLLLLVLGILIAGGVVICVLSTFIVVGRLLSARKSDLYY